MRRYGGDLFFASEEIPNDTDRSNDCDARGRNQMDCSSREASLSFSVHGRRGLLLMAAVPLILPQYHQAAAASGVEEASIISSEIRKVLSKTKAAGVLRLAFHDAGTFDINEKSGGMNGSVIYELERPENAGLNKALKVLNKAKKEIEKVMQVSWADLIALGGAEAVSLCKGPVIPIKTGRVDSMVPDPPGKLPLETLDASGLKRCFIDKGFSTQDLVSLSGAHTLGGKGFGNPVIFDNAYFKILLEKPWNSSDGMASMIGLPSDRALAEDEECLRWITAYANDQEKFFKDFSGAYIKLVNSGASWRAK